MLLQIVGLTASVGVGRAKTTDGAIAWIKTMMANMDAEELATVRVNVVELSEYVIVPDQSKISHNSSYKYPCPVYTTRCSVHMANLKKNLKVEKLKEK